MGMHLLLLGLSLEALTLVLRQRISFPIRLAFGTQLLLTVPLVAACLTGVIWFNRTIDLIRVNLLHGDKELVTHGPFAYVRHPLYSILLMTIPPLFVVWFADLLFVIPWILAFVIAHQVVRIEERGLEVAFGEGYERYRRVVPALVPYRGAGGRRHQRGDNSSHSPGLE